MSPGIRLALGRDRRRGIRNGDRVDHQTPDLTTTDIMTSAEDWILQEVPKLSTILPEVHHRAQELVHQHRLALAVEVHHRDRSSES